MCNKIHHSITAGVSASAGGGGAGSGRGAAVGRGKHPRMNVPMLTSLEETVRDMSFDCVVSKGYHCLVTALLGRTQNDGRMTISPRQNMRTCFTRLLLLLLHLTMMKSSFTNSDVVWNPTQRCSSALPPISHIL